ncbi:hypothetical protein ACHAXS_007176, partial [Conticribra weissflogii]
TSFPVQHDFAGDDYLQRSRSIFGESRIEAYNDFLKGCILKYGKEGKGHFCTANEKERIHYNNIQPPDMTNYTDIGFKKLRVSNETFSMIQRFWKKRIDEIGQVPGGFLDENWPPGNTYTNHWSSPTKMISVYMDRNLTEAIYKEVEHKLKAWIPDASGFSRSSLYGIRIYTSESILATHVDRDPLISSAIINVDQSVTEPWPLEVYGHDGKAYNITMMPGDMVLYESHSILHGRPFALQGDYYANIFVHFAPFFDEISELTKKSSDEL